tara:strand:- start:35975 stop:37132 length:1158 start_codon:yes stop_codon:yes gene_type:complete
MVVHATTKTLETYVQQLVEHPEVLEILSRSNSNAELASAEMGLPDPVIILGVDNLPVNDPSFDKYLPSSKVYGFKQAFPNYSLRKAMSSKKSQLSKQEKLMASYIKSKLEYMLVSTLIKLDKVEKQQKIAKVQLSNYKELESYFKGRLESGSGVYWRFSQVDVERSLVEQKINNLIAEQDEIEGELIRLVGEVPKVKVYEIVSTEWSSVDDMYPVSIAQEKVAVKGYDVEAANAAYGFNYGVQALYKERESGQNFDGEDWFSIQATVSIPLWSKWNQAPKKRAALAQQNESEQRLEKVKRIYLKEMKTLQSKRDAALKNVHILHSKNLALKDMISAAERTYESGETSLDAVLESQISRLSIQSQLEEERFKHMSLLAKINSYIRK